MTNDRLSLAGWSLVRRFRSQDNPLALLDFPRVARQEFGFDAIEINSPFFTSLDDDYLEELRGNAEREGVQLLGIAVDHQGDLASLDAEERQRAVQQHVAWLDAAAALRCRFVRANLGGRDTPDPEGALRGGIKGFGALAEAAGERGVTVVLENHWGLTEDPENMVRVFEGVNSPHFGALLDFGNFPAATRYAALERIAPYAKTVHAKIYDFDDRGQPLNLDVARCVEIARGAGYSGVWGIEYEGKGDEVYGINRSKELMQELLGLA